MKNGNRYQRMWLIFSILNQINEWPKYIKVVVLLLYKVPEISLLTCSKLTRTFSRYFSYLQYLFYCCSTLVHLLRAKIYLWISPAAFCYQHRGEVKEAEFHSAFRVYGFMQIPLLFSLRFPIPAWLRSFCWLSVVQSQKVAYFCAMGL